MIKLDFRKPAFQQGINCLFGLAAGFYSWIMMGIAYEILPGIVFGSIAIATSVILVNAQQEISTLASLSLIPLGLILMVYGMNSWPYLSFAERLTESLLSVFYAGYFIFGVVHGLLFIGELIKGDTP